MRASLNICPRHINGSLVVRNHHLRKLPVHAARMIHLHFHAAHLAHHLFMKGITTEHLSTDELKRVVEKAGYKAELLVGNE